MKTNNYSLKNKKEENNFVDNNKTLIICVFIALTIIFSFLFWFLYTSVEIDNSGVKELEIIKLEEAEKTYFNPDNYPNKDELYQPVGEGENRELVLVTKNYVKKTNYNEYEVYEKITREDGTLDLVKNENYFRKDTLDSSNKYYHRENNGKNTTFTPFEPNYYLRSELDKHQLYERITENGNTQLINADNKFWLKSDYNTDATFYTRTGEGDNSELKPIAKNIWFSNEYIEANTSREYVTPRKVEMSTEEIVSFTFDSFNPSLIDETLIITKRDFVVHDNPSEKGENYSKTTFNLEKNSSKVFYIIGQVKRRKELPHFIFTSYVNRSGGNYVVYSIIVGFSVTISRGDGDEITWKYDEGSIGYIESPDTVDRSNTIAFNQGTNITQSIYDYSYNNLTDDSIGLYFRGSFTLKSLKDLNWGNYVDKFKPQ